jgi:sRNA-binding carbon storage regulator CsrA
VSYLVLSIKPNGECIDLKDRDGNWIATIVARPVQGRVKVGINAGDEVSIVRRSKVLNPKEASA